MTTTTDGRHERHMMRQRGAGARSIPTNFGFVFEAGPIQLSDAASTTLTSTPAPNLPFPRDPLAVEKAAPKRKRVLREEVDDDQLWFQKRSKKTTTRQPPPQQHAIDAALVQQPPPDTTPKKKRVVRKRILVPKPRQKPPSKSNPELEHHRVSHEKDTEHKPNEKTVSNKRVPRKPVELSEVSVDQPAPPHSVLELPAICSESQKPADKPEQPKEKRRVTKKVRVLRATIAQSTGVTDSTREGSRLEPSEEAVQAENHLDIGRLPANQKPQATSRPIKTKSAARTKTTKQKAAAKPSKTSEQDKEGSHSSKPSALEVDDIDSALVEAENLPLTTKRVSKARKRVFDDDPEIDLDAMLSGIQAMAGTKATKSTVSESSRPTKRRLAVS